MCDALEVKDRRVTSLAQLVSSRICHDLISPVGAIHNGLELLSLQGDLGAGEMVLIADSVAHAEARVRFFRLAYGSAGDGIVELTEIRSILDTPVMGNPRLHVTWSGPAGAMRRDVQLAFLALQCVEHAMPYGGTINISQDANVWRVVGTADRLKVEAALWAALETPSDTPNVTAAQVQFALLPAILSDHGRALQVAVTDTMVSIAF
ncbi:MAG: histidine phosphotransferase family protein [Pseudomonadota bacterium]